MKISLSITALVLCAGFSHATITLFDLQGSGGFGLLTTNEPGSPAGGSGGEFGAGISFDDTTNLLTINIRWGSSNGFTDLTGNATDAHVHLPTPSAPPGSFSESTGVLVGFAGGPGWSADLSSGGFSGSVSITEVSHVTGLLEGRTYINIHTAANPGGEIRGNLVPVPEPGAVLASLLLLAPVAWRERRHFLRCRAGAY